MFWHEKENDKKSSSSSLPGEITELYSEFMPNFDDETKLKIIDSIAKSIEKGYNVKQIVEKVGPVVPSGYNVDDIVRTESVFLYAKKIYDFAVSSNAVATEWEHLPNRKYNRKTKQYETLEDGCTENERSGGKYLGQKYPSGHLIPPAHIGCRCSIIVIYKDDPVLKSIS